MMIRFYAVAAAAVLFVGQPANAALVAEGARWAVASGHAEATTAGLAVLREGGNAVDAAVAASLALGVAEPYGSGLGGKLVLLHHDAESGEVTSVEALCAAPRATDVDRFAALPRSERRYRWRSVCVPGLPAGLVAAHERWGSKPWAELFGPAIALAENGVTVCDEMHALYRPHGEQLASHPETARFYSVAGQTPEAGAVLKNADLAESLRRFAARGRDGFYRGATAERIVEAANEAGSPMSLEDFASYQARVGKPLAINYRGFRIYGAGPPLTGGTTVLAALKAQEETDWPNGKPRDAEYIDRVARYLLCLYPSMSRAIGDVPEAGQRALALLSARSIRSLRSRAARLSPTDPEAEPVAMSRHP